MDELGEVGMELGEEGVGLIGWVFFFVIRELFGTGVWMLGRYMESLQCLPLQYLVSMLVI